MGLLFQHFCVPIAGCFSVQTTIPCRLLGLQSTQMGGLALLLILNLLGSDTLSCREPQDPQEPTDSELQILSTRLGISGVLARQMDEYQSTNEDAWHVNADHSRDSHEYWYRYTSQCFPCFCKTDTALLCSWKSSERVCEAAKPRSRELKTYVQNGLFVLMQKGKHIQPNTMANSTVINVTKIAPTDISFAEPRKNKQGGTTIGFRFNGQNCNFRIPAVSFPGGLMVRENENKDGSVTTSYTLSASLKGCDPFAAEPSTGADDTSKLYNFMLGLQEHIIKAAAENSGRWFGKKRGEESIRDSFNKMISVSVDRTGAGEYIPNGKYPPSLRFKLPVYDGQINLQVIDSDDNDVPVSLENLAGIFPKGSSAKLVLSGQIYVVGSGFGVTWRVTYAQVYQQKRPSIRDYFKDDVDDTEDVEEEETEGAAAEKPATPPAEEESAPAAPVAAAAETATETKGRRRKVA
jgi:hypothetical protein